MQAHFTSFVFSHTLLGCRSKKQHIDKRALTLVLEIPGCSRWQWVCGLITVQEIQRLQVYPFGKYFGVYCAFNLVNFWAAWYGEVWVSNVLRGPSWNPRSGLAFLGKPFLFGSVALNGEPKHLSCNVVSCEECELLGGRNLGSNHLPLLFS